MILLSKEVFMCTINLSGEWSLKLDAEKEGIKKEYFKNSKFEQTIFLPGTVSEQKKSPEIMEKATGYLTDPFKYEGWAWFHKEVTLNHEELKIIDSVNFRLCLERTRYSTVWINGRKIGENNTICGKQFFEFVLSAEECKKPVNITILVSNVDYIVPGGHMTSADTQTNWNGITGELSLSLLSQIRLENTKIDGQFANNKGLLKITTDLTGTKETECSFVIEGIVNEKKTIKEGKNTIQFELNNIEGWSDTKPRLYQLQLLLNNEIYTYKVGFRTFKANGKYLECNGKKVFLRGKHDGMIFPETGYAPTDKESWLKTLKTAKEYGINHYRFHTCCPPEAAFYAADELGIYMSPELPFWGTIQAPGEEGFNQTQQDYLISEGFHILKDFGNHPSFVMMSLGNELWGSEARLDEIMKAYHDFDSTRLYTGGSNNFQFWPRTTEHEDYFVGVRFSQDALIRGSYAQCDAPLGFVQTDEPNTNHNYDKLFQTSDTETNSSEEQEIEIQFGTGIKKIKTGSTAAHFLPNKPCISHEVGQYCMYPNFEENQRFTGVLKPYNFEEFHKRLLNAGMENQAQDFFRDSSRLAVQCYKTEIEAALRSNELSGFQLLDIQDFTGQGTAVVGVLNAFMESKGIVTGEQWRSFCNETVLLASFDKFVYEEDEELNAQIIFHNYSDISFKDDFVTAFIIDTQTDEILCEEQFDILQNCRGNQILGTFKYKFDQIDDYKKYALLLILNSTDSILNSYTLHVYPKANKEFADKIMELNSKDSVDLGNAVLTKNLEYAESVKNKKVIYFLADFTELQTIPGTYCTDFWCYPMFRSISEGMKKPLPTGTLGLTVKKDSPLVKAFATDTYTTPKWYNLISHSTCVNLADKNITPVVQMIDNFERNWKLGILWEDKGIIYCTSRIWEIAHKPEVQYFVKNLIN